MMQSFWDKRYTENESVYGVLPNAYFKNFIDTTAPGTILLPAEGEGRNAIYAASKGWQVDAFDYSKVAQQKALEAANAQGLHINYAVKDIDAFKATKQYDAVALIFVHLPRALRLSFHAEVYKSIKSGGFLVLEAFAKEQLYKNSGGPKDAAMLYDVPSLCSDFNWMQMLHCEQKKLILDEGEFHKGEAELIRFTAQRL
jgi:hypothetical protein